MWIRYQQLTSKMASFDPKDIVSKKEAVIVKHPLKRFEPTLRTSLKIAIPLNLERLKKHKVNIEKHLKSKKWKELNIEQINASRTVQQLQSTIRELEKVKNQLNSTDLQEFEDKIAPMRTAAINAIEDFASVQNSVKEINSPLLLSKKQENNDVSSASQKNVDYSKLRDLEESENHGWNIQVQDHQRDAEELAACQSWDNLRDGLIELNSLVKDFATVVHNQQEMVDRIEDNIEKSQQDVNKAAIILGQASKFKAAAIPMAGALVGGLIGGPIGLIAGFKIAGAVTAVGGGIVGYQGGKYLKNKHDAKVETELQNLSNADKNE